jgi:histidinol-phosphatase (PHP family)
MAVHYYQQVGKMVCALRPEIVGHLDLIRKDAGPHGSVDTPRAQRAALEALEAVKEHGGILDCNTAGYRKGLGGPYPRPWFVAQARRMDIPFCFGDDSHCVDHVGAGIPQARQYLLENGVNSITRLIRRDGAIVRETVPLAP